MTWQHGAFENLARRSINNGETEHERSIIAQLIFAVAWKLLQEEMGEERAIQHARHTLDGRPPPDSTTVN